MTNVKSGTYNLSDKTTSFNYKTTLSLSEKINFIQLIKSIVLGDNGYIPILKDFAFHYAMISFFTDIDMNQFNMEKEDGAIDLDLFSNFIQSTDLASTLYTTLDSKLLAELYAAIDRKSVV